MSRATHLSALVLAVALVATPAIGWAAEPSAGDPATLGVIRGLGFEQAKTQAMDYLKSHKPALVAQGEALWNPSEERPLLDRVAETLMLACDDARKLVETARNPKSPAPTEVPALLKNAQCPPFFRANLGLYIAKQYANRRVHEQAIDILRSTRPEYVVDPASYYFYKAVAENKLLLKDDGLQSIDRLTFNVQDAPERYIVLATLMKAEMLGWKEKDLAHAGRLMEEIEGRLEIARGGPKTQGKQKEVIAILDKLIEDLEKQC
jgi:hypothetical protein